MSDPTPVITVYPDGPLVVRGGVELQSADGSVVAQTTSAVALCRCGRSALKPLCDGSHKRSKFSDEATAAQMRHVVTQRRPLPKP